ncbi:MAG: PH domain-containing protein [Rhodocyclaceae bacterium]|nr:PH domain-containing protein [Rhodocyclaceae bacterium]MBP6110433.1 PH domain-containing protein [Rhodocyclaceae bacterium]MBP6279976.1 PH domain-containing protein [Rhodocyclaceae bacterium]
MTTMPSEVRAKFNPLIKPFLVVQIGCVLAITIIGLPFALVWFLGAGRWWAQHYYDKLECHLNETTLRYRKGIVVQVEKTIPLENIQDVTFLEGPLLRHFQLSTLKFETAGHSGPHSSEMKLTGIVDAHEFRNKIMAAREALKHRSSPTTNSATASSTVEFANGAADLVTSLQGIERRLDEIIALMKEKP